MTQQASEMIDEFTRKLKLTTEYIDYETKRNTLSEDKEKWRLANNYRRARFELMHNNQDPFEQLERFEKENEHLHWDRDIEDFLEAEVALCRLIQKINIRIFSAIDIDITPDMDS